MTDEQRITGARERYAAAMHGMQSGVAAEMAINPKPTEPKHLRVGVNSAMIETGIIVQLLIDAGITTPADFQERLAAAAERERDDYQRRLSEHYGTSVTLA